MKNYKNNKDETYTFSYLGEISTILNFPPVVRGSCEKSLLTGCTAETAECTSSISESEGLQKFYPHL